MSIASMCESGAAFSPTFLDFFLFDSLRPGAVLRGASAAPPRRGFLAKQLLRSLLVHFRRDGAAATVERASKLLCPKKAGELLDEELHARELLDVCRLFCAEAGDDYRSPSQSVYGFLAVLDAVWAGARARLAEAFFHVPPAEMLTSEGELFHVVLRACGSLLQRVLAALLRNADDLAWVCAEKEGASAMWQLVLVGAMPPQLVRELAEPDVFFERLTFSGVTAEGCWQVSLAAPLWLCCFDEQSKACLHSAGRSSAVRLTLGGLL